MTLDYAKVCGYCSTALDGPSGDGSDGVCAYLHTAPGRKDFERILKGNLEKERIVDGVTSPVTLQPDGRTSEPDGVTSEGEIEHGVTLGVTLGDDGVTQDDDGVTGETRQQRHYRANRERINQERRDRRNHT